MIEFASEIESERAEGLDGFGSAELPAGSFDGGTFDAGGNRAVDFEQADVREVGVLRLFKSVFAPEEFGVAPDGHFHVGLTGADPDFADEHVVERNGGCPRSAGDDDRVGTAGPHCGQNRFPYALIIRDGIDRFPRERDLDTLSRGSGSDDADRLFALKHHVAAVNVVHGKTFRIPFRA